MKKLELKKILEAMKPVKEVKKVQDTPKDGIRVRDMRQEAMDMGSVGANDYFKENQQ